MLWITIIIINYMYLEKYQRTIVPPVAMSYDGLQLMKCLFLFKIKFVITNNFINFMNFSWMYSHGNPKHNNQPLWIWLFYAATHSGSSVLWHLHHWQTFQKCWRICSATGPGFHVIICIYIKKILIHNFFFSTCLIFLIWHESRESFKEIVLNDWAIFLIGRT